MHIRIRAFAYQELDSTHTQYTSAMGAEADTFALSPVSILHHTSGRHFRAPGWRSRACPEAIRDLRAVALVAGDLALLQSRVMRRLRSTRDAGAGAGKLAWYGISTRACPPMRPLQADEALQILLCMSPATPRHPTIRGISTFEIQIQRGAVVRLSDMRQRLRPLRLANVSGAG